MVSHDIFWSNQERSEITLKLPKYWNWHDLHQWYMCINQVLDTHNRQVDVVIDFQYSSYLPSATIQKTRAILQQLHPRIDKIVMANPSNSQLSVLDTFQSLYPREAQKLTVELNKNYPVERIESLLY